VFPLHPCYDLVQRAVADVMQRGKLARDVFQEGAPILRQQWCSRTHHGA
jgi:hypothetical protein